jgi:EmrB/QacA subfamily drug resistance transporter
MAGIIGRSEAIALLVAGAFFMENLDGTVVVTAMPQMAASFGVHPADLNIGVSAYMLTLAVLIPASGWVADRLGARRVFTSAIALFTLASMLCGLSQGLGTFTAARIVQGIGGAMMVPVGRLAVLRTTPKPELMRAIATITWPGLAAPVLGPPVGGFITTYASWHWIFFLNLPLGVIGILLAGKLIPRGTQAGPKPFDATGFVLVGLACFGLMYALDQLSRAPGAWPAALPGLAASLAIGALAIRHTRRHAHPLVDPWALGERSFAVTIRGGSLFRISIGAIPFLLPLLFQVGFGLSAFHAGLLVLTVFAGNLAMKLGATRILRRFSFRTTLLAGGVLNAATTFACALFTPATPIAVIAALLFVGGLTRSMLFTAFNTLAFADIPQARMGGANTLFNMAQQMAMGLGIAVGALALRLAGRLWHGPTGATSLAAFHAAFIVTGLIAIAGVLDALTLAPDSGDHVRRRQAAKPARATG